MAEAVAADLVVLARLPAGDTSPTIRVERYYVEQGASVLPGDAVACLRSDRYVYELPAEVEGVVLEYLAEPGSETAPGAPVLRLGEPQQRDTPPDTEGPPTGRALRLTPLARKMAAVHALDLSHLPETPSGRWIRAGDIRALLGIDVPAAGMVRPPTRSTQDAAEGNGAAGAEPATGGGEQHERGFATARGSTAMDGEQPWGVDQPPVAITVIEVDLEQARKICASSSEREGEAGLSYLTCVAYAAAQALVEQRYLNSGWSDDGVILYGQVDLRIESGDGLPAVTVRRAADLSLHGLARKVHRRGEQARQAGAALAGREPALTLAASSEAATWWSAPAAALRGAALLTLGSVQRRPAVVEEAGGARVVMRERAMLTLAYDARYISPVMADRFLQGVRERVMHLERV